MSGLQAGAGLQSASRWQGIRVARGAVQVQSGPCVQGVYGILQASRPYLVVHRSHSLKPDFWVRNAEEQVYR